MVDPTVFEKDFIPEEFRGIHPNTGEEYGNDVSGRSVHDDSLTVLPLQPRGVHFSPLTSRIHGTAYGYIPARLSGVKWNGNNHPGGSLCGLNDTLDGVGLFFSSFLERFMLH